MQGSVRHKFNGSVYEVECPQILPKSIFEAALPNNHLSFLAKIPQIWESKPLSELTTLLAVLWLTRDACLRPVCPRLSRWWWWWWGGGPVIINFDVPNPQVNLFSPPCSHSEFELARTIDSEVRKLENDWNTARVLELEVGDTPSIRRNQALCESGA